MLSKFPNKTLKVGARVSLSPDSEFANPRPNSANPIGTSGRVINISYDFDSYGDGLRVEWENGHSNCYRKSDYDLIAEGEPGYLET